MYIAKLFGGHYFESKNLNSLIDDIVEYRFCNGEKHAGIEMFEEINEEGNRKLSQIENEQFFNTLIFDVEERLESMERGATNSNRNQLSEMFYNNYQL